ISLPNSSKMSDSNPVNQEVEQFNKQKLKKTNTQEKNHLPTKEAAERGE
uniref:Thymosin beta n=1 Tax=Astatotilapia calliptera TaxID=8154 RepID=A0A3P8NSZ6_ASTCA